MTCYCCQLPHSLRRWSRAIKIRAWCTQGSAARDLPLLPAERLLSATRAILQCIQRLRQQVLLGETSSTLAAVRAQSAALASASADAEQLTDEVRRSAGQITEVLVRACWCLLPLGASEQAVHTGAAALAAQRLWHADAAAGLSRHAKTLRGRLGAAGPSMTGLATGDSAVFWQNQFSAQT